MIDLELFKSNNFKLGLCSLGFYLPDKRNVRIGFLPARFDIFYDGNDVSSGQQIHKSV